MQPRTRRCPQSCRSRLQAAWLALCASLSPVAASAAPGLLIVHDAKAVQALAAAGDETWFAVQPPEATHPPGNLPPVFPPIHAEGHRAAGSVAVGRWTAKGLHWLASLPGEIATGGRRAYAIADILPDSAGAWVTGPVNLPKRPIGRFYLARIDRDGRAHIEAEDDGPAAVALATGPQGPCLARNPEPGSTIPVAQISCPGRWVMTFAITGPGAFFSWTPGHGLAPSGEGLWAVARFRGTVRVGDVEVSSPTMRDLPFLGDKDGGIPDSALAALRQVIQAQPMPPLGAVMVVRIDGTGRLAALTRLAPDALRVGVTTGESGMDPAVIDGLPLLDSDPDGRAFVFGRYEHALRAGDRRIVAPSGDEPGRHCFLASWRATGHLRWLRDIPDCTGEPIGLVAGQAKVVAITTLYALVLDPETGTVQARMALPRAQRSRQPPDLRWAVADVAGDELVLGGTFRGEAELLGRLLNEKESSAVIARVPLAGRLASGGANPSGPRP